VLAIVCLAACFARSVETKLLTSSFRLPFTSGAARRSSDFATSGFLSKGSPPFWVGRDGSVADLDVTNEGDESPEMEDGDIAPELADARRVPFVRGIVDTAGADE
jgi:hypothetical protein